ncbi:MAG: hypothetical protein DRR04_02345 [Gammaproteobacteria bacterium]|nr:MAG: hypothetical protein DRR04_02345 [Gammaproteobacteria bacterium]
MIGTQPADCVMPDWVSNCLNWPIRNTYPQAGLWISMGTDAPPGPGDLCLRLMFNSVGETAATVFIFLNQ